MTSVVRMSAGCAAAALLVTLSRTSLANGLVLDRFEPSPAGDRMFGVAGPTIPAHLHPQLVALLDYAHNPFVLRPSNGNENRHVVLGTELVLHLNASLGLWDRVSVNVNVPLALGQTGDTTIVDGQTLSAPTKGQPGDLRTGLRFCLWGGNASPLQISLGGFLFWPTAPAGFYVGDGTYRGLLQLLAGGQVGPLVWSGVVGPSLRSKETVWGLRRGSELVAGGGLAWLVDDDRTLQIGVEFYSAISLVGANPKVTDNRKDTANAEIMAHARYRFVEQFEAGLAGGTGLALGVGTPDLRMVALLGWLPDERDALAPNPPDRDGDGIVDGLDSCPTDKGVSHPDPKKNGCPRDSDADGIPDAEDGCPNSKGVSNPVPEKNGCPPDRDGDGILDVDDACPALRGSSNPDPEKNGCPSDRDGDGILDVNDACPSLKGMRSADPESNGCPADRDGDGVLDSDDACPEVKGRPDGDPRKNGCPEVSVTDKEIVIGEQVQFESSSDIIKSESGPLLDKVAAVIRDHREITQIEIQGHTDNRGPVAVNRNLSQRRANAVRKALIQRGIGPLRLTARGYGPDVPTADNQTDEGRLKNRRVQFEIRKRQSAAP